MFRFYNPYLLHLLWLIIPMVGLYYWSRLSRRRRISKFGDRRLIEEMMTGVSRFRPAVKFALAMLAYALFVCAAARPQFGSKMDTRERHGIEAIIALDVSNSMMATDVRPTRLDKSKILLSDLFTAMRDNQTGLVVYAGDAFVQLPITSDYVSARLFLDAISPSMIATQGTDIAQAIDVSLRAFTKRQDVNRALFLITDGEDNEGGAIEAAKRAAKQGVHVYVLGVGSPSGAPVPNPDADGYFQDENGTTVISRLNEPMCRDIARAGEGTYIYVDNSSAAGEALTSQVDKLAKQKLASVVYSEYNEQYQLFAALGLLLLVVCLLLGSRPSPLWGVRGAALVPLLALLSCQNNENDYLRSGNKLYADSTFDKAQVEYQKALALNAQSTVGNYNKGCSWQQQHITDSAYAAFERASKTERDTLRLAHTYHNMGVERQDSSKFAEAIEQYKAALRLNPHDSCTRYNLVLCQHQLKKQQQQHQQKQQQKQDQQQQQKQEPKPKPEQPKQDPNEMSQENAQQLLDAALQKERDTQRQLRKAEQQNARRRQLDKQW